MFLCVPPGSLCHVHVLRFVIILCNQDQRLLVIYDVGSSQLYYSSFISCRTGPLILQVLFRLLHLLSLLVVLLFAIVVGSGIVAAAALFVLRHVKRKYCSANNCNCYD